MHTAKSSSTFSHKGKVVSACYLNPKTIVPWNSAAPCGSSVLSISTDVPFSSISSKFPQNSMLLKTAQSIFGLPLTVSPITFLLFSLDMQQKDSMTHT